ncbi:HTH-type transcriptional regulator YiaJ [Pigmentiphaga humi]|uniref:HTH-type transcriptional regulator YiaJ n=1 Tax=Pigmentiphaga humi TaxID=2478468 RepID=A0A3P4B3Z4_9BURK|nr:IclR family transcriptional regulator [Pigmentiphaga humi]VCU70400.1 HTH-type transcriptional regulator YiaJ [Pigmentiphaga humi]
MAGRRATEAQEPVVEEEAAARQGGVQALETGLSVLDVFADTTRPMMLKDIAAAAQMHPAKVHRYLASFVRRGYVEQDAQGRYSLGRGALRIGLASLAALDAVRLVTPLLDELSLALEETVLAAVWGNRGPTVVQWRDSPRPVMVNVRPGSVMPLLSSATGRVFAAFMDERLTGGLIAEELKGRAAEGLHPASAGEVRELLDAVRRSQVGRVTGDLLPGVNSVSAPVFDYDGRLVLAISALGNSARFDADPAGPIAVAVRKAAGTLSARLGYAVAEAPAESTS